MALTVAALILTKDRPQYLARALKCLAAQTVSAFPLIVNSSTPSWLKITTPMFARSLQTAKIMAPALGCASVIDTCTLDQEIKFITGNEDETEVLIVTHHPLRIGELRNAGVEYAISLGANVIIHWDDDDYSEPDRIKTQLDHLEESETGVTGYRCMRFWDSVNQQAWWYRNDNPRYALGTSLCYRADVWKREPFKDLHVGEDAEWCQRVKPRSHALPYTIIAEIHGGNTSGHIDPAASEWTRASGWDEEFRKVMAL